MKWLGVFLIPLDRMLVHGSSFLTKLLGFPNNLPVPIYTPGWREALCELSVLPKNTTQCPWPGLKPGPLTPRTSTLTMRPPCLPLQERGMKMSQYLSHLTYIDKVSTPGEGSHTKENRGACCIFKGLEKPF